jgi:hypothetical protein
VSSLSCGPEKIIKKSSSHRHVRESFLHVKYLTTSSLSLIFRPSIIYSFWFCCSPVILVFLDLHDINFCFFLISLVLFRVVGRMM